MSIVSANINYNYFINIFLTIYGKEYIKTTRALPPPLQAVPRPAYTAHSTPTYTAR